MNELELVRAEIDAIDAEMIRLFENRMHASAKVAAFKRERGLPVRDTAREAALIARNTEAVTDDEIAEYFPLFLRNTIELSVRYQTKLLSGMKVAYCGTEGAFAHLAAERLFPGAQLCAHSDFAAAYAAAENGECDCAVLPLENSSAGEVGAVLDLMYSGSLYVNRVVEFPIRQCLLGVPGAEISDIRSVLSHPQALSQCADFLHTLGVETQETANTAFAARSVKEIGDPALAAIASEEAAAHFGLSILQRDIADSSANATRFAVLSRVPNQTSASDDREKAHFILLFTVPDKAGALVQALNILGVHGYNLCSLRSRPMKGLQWNYYFYIEAEGIVRNAAGEDMLRELRALCGGLKLVGSFRTDDRP